MCVSIFVCLCLCISVCCVCLYLHLWVSLYVSCMCFYVCLWVEPVSMCDCVCLCVHLCVSVCVHMWKHHWGDPQKKRLTDPWLSASSVIQSLVSIWDLCGSRNCRLHQTSPCWRYPAGWIQKDAGAHWKRVTPGTVCGLFFFTHQRHYYGRFYFTHVEIEAQMDWVPDQGWSHILSAKEEVQSWAA